MSSQTIQSVSVRGCLLDIEGTTTPIDFVYRILLLRPGNKPQPENNHATAESFETL